ncbi:lipopolysaccharide biosynthesis protein [Polynucleobacter nymphae]|uniref:lipopolysaccharide biosynthesis protein n=1 Tax=Polynucleobacter nymphae TaxID=2081043 RepID=UPI001C0C83AC|nr:MATE family efflux transporter [Polynucleobacter nymphae]MBU3607781.1 MATE family efflux transporter [Polynucleobacter nymphae]
MHINRVRAKKIYPIISLMLNKLFSFIKHLRLNAYDTNSLEGVNNERLRLLSWAVLTSGFTKLASLIIVVASIRWVSGYLGSERFGLWMTITSVITLLSFVDLGMSNSLVNIVSESFGKRDHQRIHRAISSTLFLLTGLAVIIEAIFLSSFYFVEWADVVHATKPEVVREVAPSIAIYVTIFLISMPLSIVHKVQIGLQESWKSNLWSLLGQLFAIFFLGVAVYFEAGVPFLILAVAGGPAVATLINFGIYFFLERRDYLPKFNVIGSSALTNIGRVGGLFLIMQFLALVGNASDNIVIAKILGLSDVSTFAIVQKLAMILGVSQLFISPMWPIFGEAIARGDYDWAQRALKKIIWVSFLIGALAGATILFFGSQIIKIWVGHPVETSVSLMVGFALYSILMNIGGSLSVYLNNGSFLKRQISIYTLASIVAIGLKIFLVWHWQSASGAIWGTVIGYSIFYVIPAYLMAFPKNKSNLNKLI